MTQIEKSIEVEVPVRTTYNQWTQFESFPMFMEGVKDVRQLDSKKLHWHAEIGGRDLEWDAVITEQIPDRIISWRSVGGKLNAGSVSFDDLGLQKTRVTLRLEYDPEGVVESVGSAIGVVSAKVDGDLKRFKEFIEKRGHETGAWRGKIQAGQVKESSSAEMKESA